MFDPSWRTIRVPVHMVETIKEYKKAQHELNQELDRLPTREEMAKRLDILLEKVVVIESTMAGSDPPWDGSTTYPELERALEKFKDQADSSQDPEHIPKKGD
ncbi:MAG TPA: sigma-70 domain-containing protein [Candidatus Paceibacterota bacterium]